MVWVLASDRLPILPNPLPSDTLDERGILFVNRKHSCAMFHFPSYGYEASELLKSHASQGEGWEIENWEWLDENN